MSVRVPTLKGGTADTDTGHRTTPDSPLCHHLRTTVLGPSTHQTQTGANAEAQDLLAVGAQFRPSSHRSRLRAIYGEMGTPVTPDEDVADDPLGRLVQRYPHPRLPRSGRARRAFSRRPAPDRRAGRPARRGPTARHLPGLLVVHDGDVGSTGSVAGDDVSRPQLPVVRRPSPGGRRRSAVSGDRAPGACPVSRQHGGVMVVTATTAPVTRPVPKITWPPRTWTYWPTSSRYARHAHTRAGQPRAGRGGPS